MSWISMSEFESRGRPQQVGATSVASTLVLLPPSASTALCDFVDLHTPGYTAAVPVLVHVTERTDGRWSCAYGRVVSLHDGLPVAIAHVREITRMVRPADVLIHGKNGQVDNIAAI